MAADDATGGARHVGKNGIEGATIPPAGRCAAIGGAHLCRQVQARQSLFDAAAARRFKVEGEQFQRRIFEQVCRFAAGGGAGVKHTGTGRGAQDFACPLCAGILHRYLAVKKTR